MKSDNGISHEMALADAIEAKAWSDLFAAAPPAAKCAVDVVPLTEAILLSAGGLPVPLMNRVIGLYRQDLVADDTLTWIQQAYRNAGVAKFWLHGWPEAGIPLAEDRLHERGWTQETSVWRKFLYDLDYEVAPGVSHNGLSVHAAQQDEAEIAGAIVCRSHGLPASMVPWISALVDRPKWQVFLACDDSGTPIAAGALFIDGTHAWLGIGSTLEEARGQGAQQLLLATRLRAAQLAGCSIAATETGLPRAGEPSPSLNNIKRSGFRDIGGRTNYLWSTDHLK
jgi:GNAT superfamily N-acetyltransferase